MGWWAPGTKYFSSPERIEIAGVPLVTRDQEKATREEYQAYLRQVAGTLGLDVELGWRVEEIERAGEGFEVGMRRSVRGVGGAEPTGWGEGKTRRVRTDRVVLAIGNMHTARLLGVPGEGLGHVSHYLSDPHEYYGRDVLVVGGKNSAVEAAIRLYRVGARVTVSYRGERFDPERIKYWLLPEIEWLIRKGRIGFLPGSEVESIGEGEVRLRQGGTRVVAPADRVVLLTGYEQDATLFERCGVELEGEERRPVFDPRTMETNIPGLYVAGTATAGSQRRARVFIETSHVHASRIARAITGRGSAGEAEVYGELEES
jgi:thioredoxin reductase (NADPH)